MLQEKWRNIANAANEHTRNSIEIEIDMSGLLCHHVFAAAVEPSNTFKMWFPL